MVFFDHILTLSGDSRVHRAGSQLKIKLKTGNKVILILMFMFAELPLLGDCLHPHEDHGLASCRFFPVPSMS